MELFLNILWVVIAMGGLCLWRARWAHQRRTREHASWRQWTAFACALVLLFFMVSLTDDLHSELVVFEECSASRRHMTCGDCPRHSPQNHATATVYAVLTAPVPVISFALAGSIVASGESSRPIDRSGVNPGRAPPVIFL
jgi:hypothetical protein